MLAERLRIVPVGVSLNCFSPLAGIMLAESLKEGFETKRIDFLFQSPCGDYVSGKSAV